MEHLDQTQAEFRAAVDDVTMNEFRILAMIHEKPYILKDVAKKRTVARQGIGRTVESLRKRGFLKVQPYPADKRCKIVNLTIPGKAILARCDVVLKKIL
jgi:DNA-binding MarR family transcriptional regulator